MDNYLVYSDGASRGNPGIAGYGSVICDGYGKTLKEFSGAFTIATNNQMELYAVITGLEYLKEPANVAVYTDSSYICDAMNKNWLRSWIKKGWKTSSGSPVKNQKLWIRLIHAMAIHKVTFNWVRGHAGNVGNERCDKLANIAMDNNMLEVFTDEV